MNDIMGLIVIEGLDGAGKSTQISKLQELFSSRGRNCRLLHFPRTESPIYGELIARFLRGELGDIREVNPYLVALIYAGDRLDFKPVLEKWLGNGDTVLLDRYVYSNIAYQCAKIKDAKGKQALKEWILHLEFEYNGLPRPDLNIFLDVPSEFTCRNLTGDRTGDDRQYLQDKKDIHEADLLFQKDVRQAYLSLTDEEHFVKIGCNSNNAILSIDEIFSKIMNVLNNKLFNHNLIN
jgi:dTMP kinase